MSEMPAVADTVLAVFRKSASHHHRNTADELPETKFSLSFSVQPDRLGVRIKIIDEYRDGTAMVDVAVQYYWKRDISPEDDLHAFVETTAIPQVLACASTVLISTARDITDDTVPFYGLSALDGMLAVYRDQKGDIGDLLAKAISDREAEG